MGGKSFRRSSGRIALVMSLVIGLAVLSAAPAQACCYVGDPDDTVGKLDMEAASGYKAAAAAPLKLTVDLFANVRDKLFRKGGHGKVFVYLDADGDLAADYVGKVRYTHGDLLFTISGSGDRFEPLRVRHPQGDLLKMTVPGGSPPNPASGVSFFMQTVFENGGSCAGGCVDEVPDAPGWFGSI